MRRGEPPFTPPRRALLYRLAAIRASRRFVVRQKHPGSVNGFRGLHGGRASRLPTIAQDAKRRPSQKRPTNEPGSAGLSRHPVPAVGFTPRQAVGPQGATATIPVWIALPRCSLCYASNHAGEMPALPGSAPHALRVRVTPKPQPNRITRSRGQSSGPSNRQSRSREASAQPGRA
jgi:hypothetical protein